MVNQFNEPIIITPNYKNIEGGIVSSIIIDIDDIKIRNDGTLALDIENGTIKKIHMKRKGTYHGKRYDRSVQKLTFK